MVNLRSPVVKISWPIHLPGRNLSQHSSWSTCCLSWTNRIFSPFWCSLSKWPSDDNHLPWRNHRQHSSWSICCLSSTNRIFTHYGLVKQVDPLMTTIFPVDITANIVLRTVRSTTLSPPWHFPILLPVRISKIKQEDTLMTTLPNSLLILTWPLTPEDVDQDISSHLQLMSIKMLLNHSLNTSRCILLKMNVEIIFTCNSSE